jgi:RNA polymerase sigma factor (sigma-70 family)
MSDRKRGQHRIARELVARFTASSERATLISELRGAFPTVPPAEIEDKVSDAVLAAFADSTADTPSALYAYLRSVARRDLLDLMRSSAERTRADTSEIDLEAREATEPTPELALLRAEHARLAARALAVLPARRRAIVYRHLCADERRPVIAARLGVSDKAIKKQLERGLRDLRSVFGSMAGRGCTPEWQELVANRAFRLSQATEALRVSGHLRECSECLAYYSRLRSMSAAAASALPLPATGGSWLWRVRDLVHRSSRAARRAGSRAGRASGPATNALAAKAVAGIAAAATLAAGAHSAAALLHPSTPAPRASRPTQAGLAAPSPHKPTVAHRAAANHQRIRIRRSRHEHHRSRRGRATSLAGSTSHGTTTAAPPTAAPAAAPPHRDSLPTGHHKRGEFF